LNGVLRRDIPKAEEVKPRRINVKGGPHKALEIHATSNVRLI
jgi:hypothetical protein